MVTHPVESPRLWPILKWILIPAAIAGVCVLLPAFFPNKTIAPERTDYHDEQAKVYHQNEKAAEEFHGRPLTKAEKNELWELSRTDAMINQDQKRDADYDPSHDHP